MGSLVPFSLTTDRYVNKRTRGKRTEAHAVKARIYSEDGLYVAASAEMDAALRLDPESYEVNRSAAYLQYRQHRLDEAARHFEKAMTLLDADINSGNMLKSCYTALGDLPAIARVAKITLCRAEAALRQDPNNAAVVGYGANALAAQGEFKQFKEWMKRALLPRASGRGSLRSQRREHKLASRSKTGHWTRGGGTDQKAFYRFSRSAVRSSRVTRDRSTKFRSALSSSRGLKGLEARHTIPSVMRGDLARARSPLSSTMGGE